MARLVFGNDSALSLILLPLMIYHPLQLLVSDGCDAGSRSEGDADLGGSAA